MLLQQNYRLPIIVQCEVLGFSRHEKKNYLLMMLALK